MPNQPDPPIPTDPPQPKLIFNWEDWLPYLAKEDASDEEKRAMIEAVWSIVIAFVDLGWEVDGDSNGAEKTSGQTLDLKAALEVAVLDSENKSPELAKATTDERATPPLRGNEDAA